MEVNVPTNELPIENDQEADDASMEEEDEEDAQEVDNDEKNWEDVP